MGKAICCVCLPADWCKGYPGAVDQQMQRVSGAMFGDVQRQAFLAAGQGAEKRSGVTSLGLVERHPEQPQDRLAGLVPATLACRHGVQPIRGPNRILSEPQSLNVRDGQFRLCQVEGRGRLMRNNHRAGFTA